MPADGKTPAIKIIAACEVATCDFFETNNIKEDSVPGDVERDEAFRPLHVTVGATLYTDSWFSSAVPNPGLGPLQRVTR